MVVIVCIFGGAFIASSMLLGALMGLNKVEKYYDKRSRRRMGWN